MLTMTSTGTSCQTLINRKLFKNKLVHDHLLYLVYNINKETCNKEEHKHENYHDIVVLHNIEGWMITDDKVC